MYIPFLIVCIDVEGAVSSSHVGDGGDTLA